MTGKSKAAFPWVRLVILFLVLLLTLYPSNKLWRPLYPLLLGGPVLIALLVGRTERDFRLWVVYVTSFLLFFVVRIVADDLGPAAAIRYPIVADALLGGGRVPTILLQEWFYQYGSPSWFDNLILGVHLTYYFAPPAGGLLLWRFKPALLPPYLIALSATYLIGVLIHIAVPTVPPWMASQLGDLPRVYRIVYDIWHSVSPAFYAYGYQVTGGNDVAAMPSLHTAATAIIAYAWWAAGRFWRPAGAIYLLAMIFALVYLGEHYVVDALAGMVLAWACWVWARRRERRIRTVQALGPVDETGPIHGVPSQ